MKLTVNDAGHIEIKEFYVPVILIHEKGSMVAAARDDTIEILTHKKLYILKEGEIYEVTNDLRQTKG